MHIESEIEVMEEKKKVFLETRESIRKKYSKQKKKRIFRKLMGKDPHTVGNMSEQDILAIDKKIYALNEESVTLRNRWVEKVSSIQRNIYIEAKTRMDELIEKKQSYSQQLYGYILIIH